MVDLLGPVGGVGGLGVVRDGAAPDRSDCRRPVGFGKAQHYPAYIGAVLEHPVAGLLNEIQLPRPAAKSAAA